MDAAHPWAFRPDAVARRRPFGDRYTTFLGAVLIGYAVAGRGFAYLGVPPLFIGEVALALGLVALAGASRRTRVVEGTTLRLLVGLIAWAAVRVALGFPTWRLDAVRDGMVVLYGLFALVAAGLVLEQPERLRWLVARVPRLVWALVLVGFPAHAFIQVFEVFPVWPWANVLIVQTKPGDLLVFLAAAATVVAVGFQKPRPALLLGLTVGIVGLMVVSRGGMLGFVLGVSLAWLWKPAGAGYGRFVYVGALVIVLGLVVGSSGIQVNDGAREFSVEQVWENLKSVAGQSDQSQLQNTAEWRLEWWTKIVGYTVGGAHFLDGKGFGINLADDDGFSIDDEGSLRSPHNSHLTILARGGVPMVAAWLLLQGLWLWAVGRAARTARLLRLDAWAGFYAVCGALWLAAHVNATFDVYLEGPMGAIPFWTVFGLALAGTRLQKTHPHLLDDLRVGGPAPSAGPAWSWAPSADVAAPYPPASSV
ncbi:O-antigen ligase family protein [Rubrivirga sp.]|uniref:O-antigen ligase family protein n=1 Tax=Rubrivirga sp. TaxID=1885344 RepID=UPI003B52D104